MLFITALRSAMENPTMFYCVFISHSLCSVMNKKIYCSFMVLSVLPFPVIEESRGQGGAYQANFIPSLLFYDL